MMSSQTTWLNGIAAVAVSMSVAACGAAKKDEGAPDTSGTAGTSSGTAGDGAAQAGTSAAGTGAGDGAAGTGKDINGNDTPDRDKVVPTPADVLEMLDPDVAWDSLVIVYPSMYSAFDGKHDFKVPAHVYMTSVDIGAWQSIPKDAVSFDPDPDVMGGVIITVLKPEPKITIAVHTGKIGGTAPLFITKGTPEQWELGNMRYNNGVEYTLPDITFSNIVDPTWTPPKPPENLACNNCHTTGAKYFEIQHSPTQAARYSDEDLTIILTMGKKPPGVGFRVLPKMIGAKSAQELYSEFHTWKSTPDELVGLILYLRSLTPIGQGDIRLPDGTYVPAGSDPMDFMPDAGAP